MLRKYWVLFKVNWRLVLEYRACMVIWVLANTLPLVMLAVWISIADAGPVGNYGAAEFTAYYLALLFVRQMTSVWVAWELDYDIRMGELSPKLLRPIDPIHNHMALHVADKIFRLFTAIYETGRFPVSVYPPWMRGVLTFVVPIAFITTFPAAAILGRAKPMLLSVAFLLAAGFFFGCVCFWRFAVRRYSSASS